MRNNILNIALDFLAIGLDPDKVILAQQSRIPEHTELGWIFNCITTMPFLMRAHAFKDAQEAKKKEITVGLFDYPILMAADILLYDTDLVPVGKDQKQHVEMARDIAEKFNRIYGETVKLPEAIIRDDVSVVPGLDGKKMSKSYGNTIPLFANEDKIEKLTKKIVTDSDGDIPQNVYAIHRLFKTKEELDPIYKANKGKYGELKKILSNDINEFIAPLRERRKEIEKDQTYVKDVLNKGANTARELAEAKLQLVRDRLGVAL
jgi:tryptophanyl-tRNA synthetase